jgi:hypothetical protein
MAVATPRAAAFLLAGLFFAPVAAAHPAAAHDMLADAHHEALRNTSSGHPEPAAPAGGAQAAGGHDHGRAQAAQVAIAAGDTLPMGRGSLRSFVRTDSAGNVTAVGVTFDEAALEELPATDAEYVLPLRAGGASPFKEIAVNWNAHGHEPPGIYDVPHFDFHFYMIDEAGRDAITVDQAGMARINKAPPQKHVPTGYVAAPGGVPRMGAHYVDPTAFPELHGGAFKSSPILGYFNGQLTFFEPMVALSYLHEKPNLRAALKEPPEVALHGRYPTAYSVVYDRATHAYTIALEGLRER